MTDLEKENYNFEESLIEDYQHLQRHSPNHELLRFLEIRGQDFDFPSDYGTRKEFQDRFANKDNFFPWVLVDYHTVLKKAIEETENLN